MSDERERNPLDGPANGSSSSGQTPGEPEPVELLSAYLDDDPDLDPALRDDLESRLENDAELRQAHAELDVIRQGLRELRRVSAPRSFHVTPRMLGIPQPVALRQREPWYERHSGGLRVATSVAAILFIFVLGADLMVNTLSGPDGDSDDAGDTRPATELRAADDADSGAAEESSGDEAAGGEAGAGLGLAGTEPIPTAAIADDFAESAPPAEAEEEAAGGAEATAADMDADDAAEAGGESAQLEEEEAAEEESSGTDTDPATAEIALDEADATATDGAVPDGDDAEAEESQLFAEPEVTDVPTEASLYAEEPDAAGETAASDEGSDRNLRIWRIVEFGLVAVLGVLLTATVVLPRVGARGRGGR